MPCDNVIGNWKLFDYEVIGTEILFLRMKMLVRMPLVFLKWYKGGPFSISSSVK